MVCAVRGFPLTIRCQSCKNDFRILLDIDDLIEYVGGKGYIQDILYYLTPNERELIISNVCGDCFDVLFDNLQYD